MVWQQRKDVSNAPGVESIVQLGAWWALEPCGCVWWRVLLTTVCVGHVAVCYSQRVCTAPASSSSLITCQSLCANHLMILPGRLRAGSNPARIGAKLSPVSTAQVLHVVRRCWMLLVSLAPLVSFECCMLHSLRGSRCWPDLGAVMMFG